MVALEKMKWKKIETIYGGSLLKFWLKFTSNSKWQVEGEVSEQLVHTMKD